MHDEKLAVFFAAVVTKSAEGNSVSDDRIAYFSSCSEFLLHFDSISLEN